jgi:methylated-DNA-[protein]-cysteine S-methyltransferase
LRYGHVETPIGELLVAVDDDDAIAEIHFAGAIPKDDWTRDDAALKHASVQLRSYFAGKRRAFDLPLAPRGTEFQRAVWDALRRIPYGETTTYTDIAQRIGRPAAVRAVGAANGANPIPIVIPCHRVIGASGGLTGFGGGLPTKRWLLDHEARVAGHRLF